MLIPSTDSTRNGVRVREFQVPGEMGKLVSEAIVELLTGHYPPPPHYEACNPDSDVVLHVIAGLVDVSINRTVQILYAGFSIKIPRGSWYRIESCVPPEDGTAKLHHLAAPPFDLAKQIYR